MESTYTAPGINKCYLRIMFWCLNFTAWTILVFTKGNDVNRSLFEEIVYIIKTNFDEIEYIIKIKRIQRIWNGKPTKRQP